MPVATIPLEDNYNDVIGKAVRGLRVDREALAAKAGLQPQAVVSLIDGAFDESAARAVAPHLNLGADALAALGAGTYRPDASAPDGLLGFNTAFDDYFVNAYLVWDPATRRAVAFDTGSDVTPMLEAAKARGLTIELVLITHTHLDHIMKLDELKTATGAAAYVSATEPTAGAEPIEPGRRFEVGALTIEARRTSGHSVGGLSYVVTGLATPLVVVGDALFAGSMGGGLVSYEDALANNRREIFSLEDRTVICPGHGPLTTVGLEKRHNPFYPEFR
jgi:glyoxylase-like metal-dependent hydrolase (beta-lactamase superfamily II)